MVIAIQYNIFRICVHGVWVVSSCKCDISHYGTMCLFSNPCYNGGVVDNGNCKCPINFVGSNCELFAPSCTNGQFVNGSCQCSFVHHPNDMTCNSNISVNDAFERCRVCETGNTVACNVFNHTQLCTCNAFYKGPTCNVRIQDQCTDSNACGPYGSVENPVACTCVCNEGYSGLHCKSEPNPCSSNPCGNFGECVAAYDRTDDQGVRRYKYLCNCNEPYYGPRCNLKHPCHPTCFYGTCNSLYNNCTCYPGFWGEQCQFNVPS